jgi:hypothetical protein
VVPLTDLLEWWNIIFALPLGVGLLLMTAIALSGMADIMLKHGDFSHDMSGDAAHAEAAHKVGDASLGEFHHDTGDIAHGEAAEASGDTAESGEGHAEAHKVHHEDSSHSSHAESKEVPLLLKALHLFGIGAGLPITLAIPLLLVLWGGVGLITNQMLQPLLRLPALFFPLSVVTSLAVMMVTGRTAARLARRLFYTRRPTVVRRGGLIGCEGYAVYTITEEGGVAQVRDPFGNRHRIVCRIPPGETPLPPDTPLIVSRYDEEERLYIVEPHPFAPHPRHTQSPEVQSIQHLQRGG